MITDYKEALERLNHKRATTKSVTLCFEDNETNKAIIENVAIYNKLHELENIEEELGIDLVTLIKALKNGCYVKPWIEIKYSYEIRTGSDNIRLFLLDENDNDYSLEDYGKTWALTKEELL